MARGRTSKDLPERIEVVGEGNKRLYCTYCCAEFQRASLRGHLKSMGHLKAVNAVEAEETHRQTIDARANAAEEEIEGIEFTLLPSVAPAARPESRPPPPRVQCAQEQELWAGANEADFTMDAVGDDERRVRDKFNQELDMFGIWNPEAMASALGFQIGETDAHSSTQSHSDILGLFEDAQEDEFLAELLENTDLRNHPEPAIPGAERDSAHSERAPPFEVDPSFPTYPYPNYTTFLCDVLDNISPRTPISDALMKLFLWVLREAGVKDAPAFHYLRALQSKIRKLSGIPTLPFRSAMGNLFWMVDVRAVLSKDYSNKDTRLHLRVYPEILEDGSISEVFHAGKWHGGYDHSQLSPMYDAGKGYHYYVNEVAQCIDGTFIIPYRWVIFRGEVHADSHPVVVDDEGQATINWDTSCRIPVHELAANLFDLEHDRKIPRWVNDPKLPDMPNPLRDIARGDPLYSSFVNHFADDVSGNRSKAWNKHDNAYFTHANLPRKFLQQESHVHFISTSPHATAAEQFHAFKQVVQSTHTDPVRVHDALTGESARIRIFVNAEPSDNPMQSQISGHIGPNGNFFCRKCTVGGSTEAKGTDEGFHMIFSPGTLRTKQGVLDEVRMQVHTACLGVEKHVKNRQRDSGVKDAYTQYWIDELIKRARAMKRSRSALSDSEIQTELVAWADANSDKIYNPFFMLPGLDPMLDTPIEVLHTIFLGVVKYAWHWSHTSWKDKQKSTFSVRLQATDTHGLTVHAIRANYIMQYANSLIGRQLKTLAQTSIFHVHDILSDRLFDLWLTIGEMMALMWFPVIRDKETYKSDLRIAIANVLDAFSAVDPSKILDKLKLHLLVHAPDDVEQFGPLIGMCTEVFESYNGPFRYASIHSNHQAPSRDIAQTMADQESLRHRLIGGTWSDHGAQRRAGARVLDFLQDHPTMQRLVGWSPDKPPVPGSYKLAAIPETAEERPRVSLCDMKARTALNNASYNLDETLTVCKYVISQAEDVCVVGSWVCAQSPIQSNQVVLGRITELLARPDEDHAVIVLDIFEVGATRHPKFNMPVLARRYGEPSYIVIKSPDVRFAFNAQHDCRTAKCAATGARSILQERQESDRTEKYIEHKDIAQYIVNLHSLHNPHLVREVLPRNLTAPVQRTDDVRRQQHDQNAKSLREKRTMKKAAAEAKKAAQAAKPGAQKKGKRKGKKSSQQTEDIEEPDDLDEPENIESEDATDEDIESEDETEDMELEDETKEDTELEDETEDIGREVEQMAVETKEDERAHVEVQEGTGTGDTLRLSSLEGSHSERRKRRRVE